MITLLVVLCIYTNIVAYILLYDTTTVRSFRDYLKYSEGLVYKINFNLIMIIIIGYLITNPPINP